MTIEDWDEIFETMVRHAKEYLADCKSEPATVMLDELEEHYDLRRLCLERRSALAKAGLAYDDEHRLLRQSDAIIQRGG